MEIRIRNQRRDEATPRVLDLTPEDYFDPLNPGETLCEDLGHDASSRLAASNPMIVTETPLCSRARSGRRSNLPPKHKGPPGITRRPLRLLRSSRGGMPCRECCGVSACDRKGWQPEYDTLSRTVRAACSVGNPEGTHVPGDHTSNTLCLHDRG
jgi:hypothetical protein